MLKIKYIRTNNDEFILFPSTITHSEFKDYKPISAGFVQIRNNEVVCFGNSFTLGLESLPEDSLLATRQYFSQ